MNRRDGREDDEEIPRADREEREDRDQQAVRDPRDQVADAAHRFPPDDTPSCHQEVAVGTKVPDQLRAKRTVHLLGGELLAKGEAVPFGRELRRFVMTERKVLAGACRCRLGLTVPREQRRQRRPDIPASRHGAQVVHHRQDLHARECLEHAQIGRCRPNPASGKRQPDQTPRDDVPPLSLMAALMDVRQLGRDDFGQLGRRIDLPSPPLPRPGDPGFEPGAKSSLVPGGRLARCGRVHFGVMRALSETPQRRFANTSVRSGSSSSW